VAIKDVQFREFSGGLNTRDAASEIASNEISDALNVTIDERGAATKRLGYERRYTNALGVGTVSNIFDWKSRGFIVTQEGPRMHINDNAAFLTWSTSDRCGMCEFLGDLILIHPVDGVRRYDGTTVTGPPANAPLGNTCAAWQNKCWFAGNPVNPARVTYTDIGALTFNVNGFNELREKDSAKVTCLTGAAGLDIAGRPGLLAFKEKSAYRIYDSSNGAYNTIDASIGCSSAIGAVSAYGRTYVGSPMGIYYTNGLDPMVEVTAKIENFFSEAVMNHAQFALAAAGRYQDRLRFSFPAAGETFNSIAIEIHPLSGWVMVHDDAASAYASTDTDLIMGSPTVAGRVYNGYRTGADDGTAIASHMQSYWLEPNFGNQVRVRRARFVGYGAFSASLYKDYETGSNLPSLNIDITPDTVQWDGFDWDDGSVWGPAAFQSYQDEWSIGVCRSFSLRVSETSTISRQGRTIAGQAFGEVGAWTLAHVNLQVIELGMK
jgi:hypothetical protein